MRTKVLKGPFSKPQEMISNYFLRREGAFPPGKHDMFLKAKKLDIRHAQQRFADELYLAGLKKAIPGLDPHPLEIPPRDRSRTPPPLRLPPDIERGRRARGRALGRSLSEVSTSSSEAHHPTGDSSSEDHHPAPHPRSNGRRYAPASRRIRRGSNGGAQEAARPRRGREPVRRGRSFRNESPSRNGSSLRHEFRQGNVSQQRNESRQRSGLRQSDTGRHGGQAQHGSDPARHLPPLQRSASDHHFNHNLSILTPPASGHRSVSPTRRDRSVSPADLRPPSLSPSRRSSSPSTSSASSSSGGEGGELRSLLGTIPGSQGGRRGSNRWIGRSRRDERDRHDNRPSADERRGRDRTPRGTPSSSAAHSGSIARSLLATDKTSTLR